MFFEMDRRNKSLFNPDDPDANAQKYFEGRRIRHTVLCKTSIIPPKQLDPNEVEGCETRKGEVREWVGFGKFYK